MFNIFRPAPSLALQLHAMITFANSTTPAQVAETWPMVESWVLRPNRIVWRPADLDPAAPDQEAGADKVDAFREKIISEARPRLDAGVMRLFRRVPDRQKVVRAGFAGHEGVIDLAKSAFDSRVISPASSAYMLEAAMRMQDGNGGNSELPVGLKIAEAAVITGVACYAEYMIYDVAEYAIAKYSMMSLLGAATVYYIINRVSDIIKNR
ncbi:MAG: hypothetical protein WC683_11140 [bacterium]